MTLLAPHRRAVTELDAEALIKEAKRLRRRRWMRAGLVVVLAAAASGLGLALSRTPTGHAVSVSKGTSPATSDVASAGPIVSPKTPRALAVGPGGSLYVVDGGRDQILRYLPDGRFQVAAGDGKNGFSGDGGQAIDAEIHDVSAIAVAKNGTVYLADEGNGRVREILPDGIIETVAGGGTVPLGMKPVAALSASFGGPSSLFGLAIGPNGELYIGTSAIYRLSSNGMLDWVVGSGARDLNKGSDGFMSNPAFQIDFTQAGPLAVDGKGDLLVAGGYGFGLTNEPRPESCGSSRTTAAKVTCVVRSPLRRMEPWCSLGSNGSILQDRSPRLPRTASGRARPEQRVHNRRRRCRGTER